MPTELGQLGTFWDQILGGRPAGEWQGGRLLGAGGLTLTLET